MCGKWHTRSLNWRYWLFYLHKSTVEIFYCAVSFHVFMCRFNSANSKPVKVHGTHEIFSQEQRKLFALNPYFVFFDRSLVHTSLRISNLPSHTKVIKWMFCLHLEWNREKKMDKVEIKLRRYSCQSVQWKTAIHAHIHGMGIDWAKQ